jgi:hypothetical protein
LVEFWHIISYNWQGFFVHIISYLSNSSKGVNSSFILSYELRKLIFDEKKRFDDVSNTKLKKAYFNTITRDSISLCSYSLLLKLYRIYPSSLIQFDSFYFLCFFFIFIS